MTAQIIDGKKTAQEINQDTRKRAESFLEVVGRRPSLRIVSVGEDPASQSYIKGKIAAASKASIDASVLKFDSSIKERELIYKLDELNQNDTVDGMIVQLPLPQDINPDRVVQAINPSKDVDGLNPANMGLLMSSKRAICPATPLAVLRLLTKYEVPTVGRKIAVVGRSRLVGMPLAIMLSSIGCDGIVTVLHRHCRDLGSYTSLADILITAVGKPNLITKGMLKNGATVVDVGINRIEDKSKKSGHRLVGDVNFEYALSVAGAVTPVPGGVGPMTVAMLLENVLFAAESSAYRD